MSNLDSSSTSLDNADVVNALAATIEKLSVKIANQETLIAQLQSPSPAPIFASPSQSSAPPMAYDLSFKGSEPLPYYGKAEDFSSFFSRCELALRLNAKKFPTEYEKVLFAGSYLRGSIFKVF